MLIGYGRIGRAIAVRAAAFGVEVIAVDDYAETDAAAHVRPTSDLADLQRRADYVVVAGPPPRRPRDSSTPPHWRGCPRTRCW